MDVLSFMSRVCSSQQSKRQVLKEAGHTHEITAAQIAELDIATRQGKVHGYGYITCWPNYGESVVSMAHDELPCQLRCCSCCLAGGLMSEPVYCEAMQQ